MLKIKDKSNCCGCSACVEACPVKCISFNLDEEGFCYPEADENLCIHCGLCEKVCPFLRTAPEKNRMPESYGIKAIDDKLREASSSGGYFSLLAAYILSQSGTIYGAAMAEDMRSAHHIRIDSNEQLSLLLGSKYLQSRMESCYNMVKIDLDGGKKVLFSGVPCQINGLKGYLQRDYENLYCVEVICHGVPSPKLWAKYVSFLERKYHAEVTTVNFRKKKHSWNNFGLYVTGETIELFQSLHTNPYLRMFLRNMCLRPSCYQCNAKYLESMADMTIADFWGVGNITKELSDDKGVSLVLIQSDKGDALFEQVKKYTIYQKVNYKEAINYNLSYYKSVEKPQERDEFFYDMNSMEFKNLIKKYGTESWKEKVKYIIRKSLVYRIYQYLWGGEKTQHFSYGLAVYMHANNSNL